MKHVSSLEAITELHVVRVYNFVENIIYTKSYDRSCISRYMVTRDVFQVLKFSKNLKSITRVHISRNALAFIRFSVLIDNGRLANQILSLAAIVLKNKLHHRKGRVHETFCFFDRFAIALFSSFYSGPSMPGCSGVRSN